MPNYKKDSDGMLVGKLQEIKISELVEFKNHTFAVKNDQEMQELRKSIEEYGVLEPAIAFINEEGNIELISGHRRKYVCELLNIETIPVLIRDVSRDTAILIMGETNLNRRKEILPSEKAKTYRVMIDAMKRQGMRTDLTFGPVDQKLNSRKDLSKKVNESEKNIQRYLRLNMLDDDLLSLVDEKRIGLRPAVELSYLDSASQKYIRDFYNEFDITASHAQAIQLRKLYESNKLNEDAIFDILSEEKPNQRNNFRLSSGLIKQYFSNCSTPKEIEAKIIKAMELYDKQMIK